MSAGDGNTAVLPVGQTINKNTEITPPPDVLAQLAYVVVVKGANGTKEEKAGGRQGGSGVVLVLNKQGQVIARYFDESFAREEFAEAGLKFDEMLAHVMLKREDEARKAARRTLNRPDRRLRSERRKDKAKGAPQES